MSEPNEHDRAFVEYLQGFVEREDRAPLAALRRGLGKEPGEASEMFPYIVPWVRTVTSFRRERAYYLIASLFALHQRSWPASGNSSRTTNLGASMAWLARTVESGSLAKRFVALLNSHEDDLPDHLTRIITLLKAHDIPVDWAQLLHDVQGWYLLSRTVQRDWARGFWGSSASDTHNASDDDAAATDSENVASATANS